MKSDQGFSLIELLAATVILGLLITVVLAPLSNLFRRTADSGQALQTSTQAQQLVEAIKGQWRTVPTPSPDDFADEPAFNDAKKIGDDTRNNIRNLYDRSCYPAVTIPPTATVVIRGLNRDGTVVSTLSCVSASPSVTDIPVMKRITVTVRNSDAQTTLSVDVPRPPANDANNNL